MSGDNEQQTFVLPTTEQFRFSHALEHFTTVMRKKKQQRTN